MLKLTMSLAYRIVFECPKDRKNINLQKKCSNISLSESDAMKMFGNEEIACTNPNCGWHGKARRTRLLRILPFDWVLAPATSNRLGSIFQLTSKETKNSRSQFASPKLALVSIPQTGLELETPRKTDHFNSPRPF